jgi:hypothetical protein
MNKDSTILLNLTSGHLGRVLTPLSLFSQAQVSFHSDVVHFVATNGSRTVKISITVPVSLFRKSNLGDLKTGIRPPELLTPVQFLDNDTPVDFHITPEGKIMISSCGFRYRTRELDTRYVYDRDVDNKESPENSVCAKITGTDLSRGLELANKIATHCRLHFRPNNASVVLSASGDSDYVQEPISVDNIQINIECVENDVQLKNNYPLGYLCEIYDIIPETKTVNLSIRQSQLAMSYPIVDDIGVVTFSLAESVIP